jgi:hypothetical protein
MDPWLNVFIPDLHCTPLGMVDLNKPHKDPRPIFDSSFRPGLWAMAIIDFTTKLLEPEIVFPLAWIRCLNWVLNLRIAYPRQELYLGDDDVSGAFRQVKYNPNLVAMHAFLVFGTLFMSTGQTCGDCTSPANWEPVARNRQQYARFLWKQIDTLAQGLPHLPKLLFAPPASSAIMAKFVQATPDSLNTGVLDKHGARLPPQYDHHVDDCLYADIQRFFPLTVAASILALYLLLGHPGPNHRDPVSWEKFVAKLTHRRKAKGFIVDTRRMEVSIPDYKQDQVVELLATWTTKESYTLLEAAELLGLLNNLSEICRWARPRYYALQSAMRLALQSRYCALRGWRSRHADRIAGWKRELPGALAVRLDPLIQREMAATILWNTRQSMSVTTLVRKEMVYLHGYLAEQSNLWAISIGHLVKRMETFTSTGDASNHGGGAHCSTLHFWFSYIWSPEVTRRANLPKEHPGKIHINSLEFVVALIQLAATITRLEAPEPPALEGLSHLATLPYQSLCAAPAICPPNAGRKKCRHPRPPPKASSLCLRLCFGILCVVLPVSGSPVTLTAPLTCFQDQT